MKLNENQINCFYLSINRVRMAEFDAIELEVTNKIIKINVGDLVRNHLMQPFYGIQKYTNQPNLLIVMNAMAYWLCVRVSYCNREYCIGFHLLHRLCAFQLNVCDVLFSHPINL